MPPKKGKIQASNYKRPVACYLCRKYKIAHILADWSSFMLKPEVERGMFLVPGATFSVAGLSHSNLSCPVTLVKKGNPFLGPPKKMEKELVPLNY